jgi:hypothetical protein
MSLAMRRGFASDPRHQALLDFIDYGHRSGLTNLLQQAFETDRPIGRSKLTWAQTDSL